MFLYELTDYSLPKRDGNTILHTLNDFEKPAKNWTQNDKSISNEIKYEGNNSMQVFEYSSTFSIPMDSLKMKGLNKLYINSDFYCYFIDKTSAKIVVSVENEEGAYFWQGVEINKYIKAFSNWWPINFETEIKCNDIKPNSLLKVYVWNMDKDSAYIDNFEISIIEI